MITELTDESKMPIGKYQGEKMANVPANYLLWYWKENEYEYNLNKGTGLKPNFHPKKRAVLDYIYDNLEILKNE